MINIICATYYEAEMLIKHYELKKTEYSAFSIYENEEKKIRLVISGVGKNAAATAIGVIGARYELKKADCIINFGVAAGKEEFVGQVFLCNKIVEQASDKTFYPDMLLELDMPEAAVITVDFVIRDINELSDDELTIFLYDMEAAAIYQSAIHFIGPHQMCFIKLISDSGVEGKTITGQEIINLISEKADAVIGAIDTINDAVESSWVKEFELDENIRALYEKVCSDMHCSITMERELLQQFKYYQLSGNNLPEVIDKFYEEEKLPCKDKREGKVCFDELKKCVLQ